MTGPDNGPPRVVLPHTGLRVPNTRLRITDYRRLVPVDGSAFTSTLRLDDREVATVTNPGGGAGTHLLGTDRRVFDDTRLAAFARVARGPGGASVHHEEVLDALVVEATTAEFVARCAEGGRWALRQVAYVDGRDPTYLALDHADAAGVEIRRVAPVRAEVPDGSWWQLWAGDRWRDLTPRPPQT